MRHAEELVKVEWTVVEDLSAAAHNVSNYRISREKKKDFFLFRALLYIKGMVSVTGNFVSHGFKVPIFCQRRTKEESVVDYE